MNIYLPIIATITTLVAVVVGPLVTIYVANRQIRAATIAANRQQWINTLRDELSIYLSALAVAGARSASRAATDAEHQDSIDKLSRLGSKIQLLLNPHESDHAELIQLLNQASAQAWISNTGDPSQIPLVLSDYAKTIVRNSQAILKREWNRVKTLE